MVENTPCHSSVDKTLDAVPGSTEITTPKVHPKEALITVITVRLEVPVIKKVDVLRRKRSHSIQQSVLFVQNAIQEASPIGIRNWKNDFIHVQGNDKIKGFHVVVQAMVVG